jgi:WD40 repeat protein
LYEGFDEFQEIDISPDGKTLGIAKKNEVQFLDIFTGTVINTKLCQREVDSLKFSPDGQHFCVVTYPEGKQHLALTVFSWETENPIYTFYWDVLAEGTSICRFSPEGKRIYWSSDEQAKIFDIETGNSITLNMKIGGMVQIKTSLDGKYLTFGDKFGELFIFQLENTNFEPRIVTPLIDESNIYFKCPFCAAKNLISETDPGKEKICENCKRSIRLNNFTCAL